MVTNDPVLWKWQIRIDGYFGFYKCDRPKLTIYRIGWLQIVRNKWRQCG